MQKNRMLKIKAKQHVRPADKRLCSFIAVIQNLKANNDEY